MPNSHPSRRWLLPWLVAGLCAAFFAETVPVASAVPPTVPHLGVGATFETLRVGETVYRQVRVRTVTAHSIMISHADGLASIPLRALPPELQAAFSYNPAVEAVEAAVLKEAHIAQVRAPVKRSGPKTGISPFDQLLQSFGQQPEIRPSVDLRPVFAEFGLNVLNQGPRPSCAVFAIVSALEFQSAQLTGRADQFSEEYLIWATCKTLHRARRPPVDQADAGAEAPEIPEPADEGFSLGEVVAAIRAYGIPLRSSLPYAFVRTMAVADPSPEIVEEARRHRRVSVVALPGRDPATRLANLIQALNAGFPVPAGLAWPNWRASRSGYLSRQQPMGGPGHGVAIVGYENKTGAIEDTVFIFKNSWGPRWGAGGYGYVTYGYLSHYLEETALMEVTPERSS